MNDDEQTDIPEEAQDHNTEFYSWEFPAYEKHDRSLLWYIIAAIIVAFLLIYSVVTNNFLFAVIIVVVAVILVYNAYEKPQTVRFAITDRGIRINDTSYDYDELSDFWIIYNPPRVKTLYFRFKSALRPDLPVRLLDNNPIPIRALLQRYLSEDLSQESENLSDVMNRTFKL